LNVREVIDQRSFRAWLGALPKERRREAAVALATRAALRAFPYWAAEMPADWARKDDMTALPLSRSLLISAVAVKMPTTDIKASAASYSSAASSVASSAASSASQASSASYARSASAASARSTRSVSYAASDAAFWAVLRADCTAILTGDEILHRPLWSKGPAPEELQRAWTTGRTWMEAAPGHAFWIRWYDAILAGRPLTGDWDSHWQLMHNIALIVPEDWGEGKEPDAFRVAGIIEGLCKPYALNKTRSNEAVELNPETGLLRLVPVVPLEEGFHRYIRRKLTKALRVFGDHPGNEHTAILPELTLLRDAIEDAENLPVELYDACTSITTRVAARIDEGSLPPEAKDPLIADFLKHIREAGAEIFSEDEETQKALARRNKVAPSDALLNESEAVQEVAEVIAENSEPGPLARMGETAAEVLDPTASAEEQHALRFKFVSRLLRGMGALGWNFMDSAAKSAGSETGKWVVRAPVAAAAFHAVLQFLGLA
jgi:hypothetical protein